MFADSRIVATPARQQTATGALSTRQSTPIIALEFNYALNPAFVKTTTVAGGAATQANSMCVLTTSTGATDSSMMESLVAMRYTGGSGNFASFTSVFTAGVASSQQEVGIGDSNNGYFFGYVGTSFGVIKRSNITGSVVDTFVPQSAWSVDHMDGTGPTGFSINPAAGNVYKIQYLWHGFGAVLFFVSDGVRWQLAHIINSVTQGAIVPHTANPCFPLHARVWSTGATTALAVSVASMGAFEEGVDPSGSLPVIGLLTSYNNAKSSLASETSLFTAKVKATNVYGGTNTSKVRVKILHMSMGCTSSVGTFRLLLNPTIGGTPSFADLSSTTSVLQIDTAGTTTGGTGTEKFSVQCQAGSQQNVDLSGLNIILNPGDTICLACNGGGTAPGAFGSLQFIELP